MENKEKDASKSKRSDQDNKWSPENAVKATEVFKIELEKLIQHVNYEKIDDYPLDKIEALCSGIGKIADNQYATSEDDEANFYEKMLDAPVELKIQDFMFGFIKSCVIEETKNGCGQISYSVTPPKVDHLIQCIAVMAHIASGSSSQTAAVKGTGIVPYAEKFAVQTKYPLLSFHCLKLLVCFMSEDREYAEVVSGNMEYYSMVCELNIDDSLDLNAKAWLMFFCDWAFHCMKDNQYFSRYIVNNCFAAACSYLHADTFFIVDKSVNLIRTLFEKEHIWQEPVDSLVYMSIERSVPRLVSLLSCPSGGIAEECIMTLGNILRNDVNYFNVNACKGKLLHVALSSGLLNHIPQLLSSDSAVVLERVLWLISIFVVNEQPLAIKLETLYVIMPYLCYHLKSKSYLVVSRAFFALYNTLQYPIRSRDNPDREYIENNPEILRSVLTALRNLDELEKDASLYSLDEEEKPGPSILDYGLRCVEFIVSLGYDEDSDDEKENEENDKIANYCNEKHVFETFRFLTKIDLARYDEEDILDLDNRLGDMRVMLKRLLEVHKIVPSDDFGIFNDLLEGDSQ